MLSSISDLLIAGDERIELLFLCPEPPVFSTFLDKIKWLQLVTFQVKCLLHLRKLMFLGRIREVVIFPGSLN